MKLKSIILLTLVFTIGEQVWSERAHAGSVPASGYVGSSSCKECHEKFHQLWSTSWHGLAMRPYTAELAENELTPQKKDIVIGEYRYRAEVGDDAGRIIETGPEDTRQYPIEHVIGGKVTYNFLTTLPNGRLQALPVGYDGEKKEWFDAITTSASGALKDDSHVDWKANPSGFYTACPSCHVSQYAPSYDISSTTYSATWTEPGVNCETCHGPAEEHVRIAQKAPKGQLLPELKIIRTKTMTAEQRNDLCSICHGHIRPLDASYRPGDQATGSSTISTLPLWRLTPSTPTAGAEERPSRLRTGS